MEKKIPERTCMGCNNQKPKKELLRIVKSKDNIIEVDTTGKKSGRGAYICKDEECLKKLIKSKRLQKVFEMDIPSEVYEDIRNTILSK